MRASKKFMQVLAVALVAMSFMGASVTAVADSDVSTTITAPDADSSHGVGGILADGVYYTVELDNNYDNDTTVDVHVTVANSTGDQIYAEWHNDTSVNAGDVEDVTGTVDGLEEADYDADGEDVTLDATATYTDDPTGDTVSQTDSVGFEIYESQLMTWVFVFVIITGLLGAAGKN